MGRTQLNTSFVDVSTKCQCFFFPEAKVSFSCLVVRMEDLIIRHIFRWICDENLTVSVSEMFSMMIFFDIKVIFKKPDAPLGTCFFKLSLF